MNTAITYMAIADITVGERRRTEMGDIKALAQSIHDYGLLHPIIVDDDGVLIAGGRRLAAMQALGCEDVPVRRWQSLGEDDRRIIELEENLQRKDLTAAEQSRNLTNLASLAEKVDRETGEIRADSARNPRGGRPEELGSLRRVSERIGVPVSTIRDAQKHVAVAERHPFLQKPEWKQYHALQVGESLDKLPDGEREDIASVIQEQGVPPETAITILKTWESTPQPARDDIRQKLKSDDDRDVSAAKAMLVNEPPPPNRIVTALEDTEIKHLKPAIKRLRGLADAYPKDRHAPHVSQLVRDQEIVVSSINALIAAIEGQDSDHAQAAAD